MKKYLYDFYQIIDFKETDYGWKPWFFAKDKFNIEDYHCVYKSGVWANTEIEALDKLFTIFNCRHPRDYKGYSMSVSDVIALTDNNKINWYYCDALGWKKLSEK